MAATFGRWTSVLSQQCSPDHVLCDSVLAECGRTANQACAVMRYREFIVYDRAQTYCEFVIKYRLVF